MYVEVLTCENVHTTPLPPKLLDTNLRTDRSEDNLTLYSNNSGNSSQVNLQQTEKPPAEKTPALTSENNVTTMVTPQMPPPTMNFPTKKINGKNNLSIYNDSHADCWSIHSDSGLHLNSNKPGNFKSQQINSNHHGRPLNFLSE